MNELENAYHNRMDEHVMRVLALDLADTPVDLVK